MPSQQALEQVTNASYQRELATTNKTLSAGGEGADDFTGALSDYIVAGATDELFPWVRLNCLLKAEDTTTPLWWFVVKCKTSDSATPTLDDEELELLQKDGKLFARGSLAMPDPGSDQPYRKMPEVKFHNVKLKAGEELRLYITVMLQQNVSGVTCYSELEYRKVGE